jgi:probable HAF family extracellular repeat protein
MCWWDDDQAAVARMSISPSMIFGESSGDADSVVIRSRHSTRRAFEWSNGVLTDLGTAPGDKCSTAYGINDRGQVVGNAGVCHGAVDAFLSQNGSTVNLNSLIAPSPLHLKEALSINNRGEIMGIGVLSNGDQHQYVLIPRSKP